MRFRLEESFASLLYDATAFDGRKSTCRLELLLTGDEVLLSASRMRLAVLLLCALLRGVLTGTTRRFVGLLVDSESESMWDVLRERFLAVESALLPPYLQRGGEGKRQQDQTNPPNQRGTECVRVRARVAQFTAASYQQCTGKTARGLAR